MIPLLEIAPHWTLVVSASMFAVALVVALWRLLVGPGLPDRVLALDLLGFLVVGLMCLIAIMTDQPSLLTVAVGAALILFLGTAAFAMYLEQRGAP